MNERPVLRVVSGDATPEEIAAVVAAVALSVGAGEPPSGTGTGSSGGTTTVWSGHGHAHRNIRATFAPSEHGWRTSYWPR